MNFSDESWTLLKLTRQWPFLLVLMLIVACAGSPSDPFAGVDSGSPSGPTFSGLIMQNCMLQVTSARLYVDEIDSGAVSLGRASRQGAGTTCTDSRVFRIRTGSHHTVITVNGQCSGSKTPVDVQRNYPGGDTTRFGLYEGNC